jgi:hypothetical protein
MGQLFFKKHLQDAIRAGSKKTTIRRWNRPMVRAGERAFSPGLGWLAVVGVERVELDKLDNADALADGFDTIAALREILLAFYPDHAADGKQWFRVSFSLAEEVRRSSRSRDDGQPRLF